MVFAFAERLPNVLLLHFRPVFAEGLAWIYVHIWFVVFIVALIVWLSMQATC